MDYNELISNLQLMIHVDSILNCFMGTKQNQYLETWLGKYKYKY